MININKYICFTYVFLCRIVISFGLGNIFYSMLYLIITFIYILNCIIYKILLIFFYKLYIKYSLKVNNFII